MLRQIVACAVDTSCQQTLTPAQNEAFEAWKAVSGDKAQVQQVAAKLGVKPEQASNKLGSVNDLICNLPSIEVGFGADAYAGLGGSVGANLKIDIPSGQVGAGFNVAVGAGLGIEAGPSVGASPSGSGIVSANITSSVGGGYMWGVVGTRNLIGTDSGQNSVSIGRLGTPIAFVNGGASVGFNTPRTEAFGCSGK